MCKLERVVAEEEEEEGKGLGGWGLNGACRCSLLTNDNVLRIILKSLLIIVSLRKVKSSGFLTCFL